MRDNRYVVEAINDESVPLKIVENKLRFKMLEELEGVLFSGEMVAIKISKERLPGERYGGLIRYQAEVKQVRQVEYVHVPPASRKQEPQPMKKEGIIRRAARKVHKALGDFIRDNNGGKCEVQDCARCPFPPCRKEGVKE